MKFGGNAKRLNFLSSDEFNDFATDFFYKICHAGLGCPYYLCDSLKKTFFDFFRSLI